MPELILPQELYFDTSIHPSITSIIRSLSALEGTVSDAQTVLQQLFPDDIISHAEIEVSSLESGSLTEKIFVKLFFGSQENLDAKLDDLRTTLRLDKIMEKPWMVLTLGITVGLAGSAVYMLGTGDEKAAASIQANNNIIIQIAADEAGVDFDELSAIVSAAAKNPKDLAKRTGNLLAPSEKDGTLKIGGGAEITRQTITAIPSSFEDTEEEHIADFSKEKIDIRATDLDSLKKGWGGIAENLSPKRARLQFDPSIKPSQIKDKTSLIASGTMIYKYNTKKEVSIKTLFVREIHEQ